MKRAILYGIPMSVAVVGILFFIAGESPFQLLPTNYARFAGIACMLLSGLLWAVLGIARKDESG